MALICRLTYRKRDYQIQNTLMLALTRREMTHHAPALGVDAVGMANAVTMLSKKQKTRNKKPKEASREVEEIDSRGRKMPRATNKYQRN